MRAGDRRKHHTEARIELKTNPSAKTRLYSIRIRRKMTFDNNLFMK